MSGISDIYTYFRSIGVDEKPHDKWVTDSLSLMPKPNLFQRVFGCCGGGIDKSSIAKVMIKLDAIITNDVEDPQERSMASFVKGVLENCRTRRDPQLVNLGKLNMLLRSIDGFPNTKAIVQEEYFATGKVDRKSNAVHRLVAADCGPLQQLPQDMLAKILTFLSLKDRAYAAATCWNWHRAAERPDSLDLRALSREEMLYVSTLTDKTLNGIKKNRALLEAYKTHAFATEVIGHRTAATGENFQYQPGSDDPILIRNRTSIDIANTATSIAHDFRNDYVMLYEKSVNKIFVVDKQGNTIHGLYEIDPELESTTRLSEENIQVTGNFHIAFQNNELWIITALGSARVYNLQTRRLREQNWEVKPAGILGAHHFLGLRHIYTSNGPVATFEVQELDNPQVSQIVPGSQNCHSLIAKTHDALYVAMGDRKTVMALDIVTGRPLQTFIHPKPSFFWIAPTAHVSNGMLYLSISPYRTEVYDILAGRNVRSISFGWLRTNTEMQVFDNKLVYRAGAEIRRMALKP